MRILVLGGDGYCGWPTSLYLSKKGHSVGIIDNFFRRQWDTELGTESLTPIRTLAERLDAWEQHTGIRIPFFQGDVLDYPFLLDVIQKFQPEAIVHFAEQRAAPYSMIDREHAIFTQTNNIVGTLNVLYAIHEIVPDCHLIKLGTLGEYGQPNIDIEEGFIDIEHNGRKDRLPFPMQPGSFYHLSKVHDSQNIQFASRTWGIRATDLHQGIVYGVTTDETENDERLMNRFDYDEYFGTALNRFCLQAASGHPITVYGNGGQTRGLIDIRDTIRCIELVALNPADKGEYRVMNQFTEKFNLRELANQVVAVANKMGISPEITHIPNPRVEKETHYYNPKNTKLIDLGLVPHLLSQATLEAEFKTALKYRDRIKAGMINPTINWRSTDTKR